MLKSLEINFRFMNKLLEGRISHNLDLLRGIAAILVLMEHLSNKLYVPYSMAEKQNLFVKLLYINNLLGGSAVIIFFVLSGLFISRSVFNAAYNDKWTWKSYLINRLSRLYTVLLPALLLTLILNRLGSYLFSYPSYNLAVEATGFVNFIGNLFFLQRILVPPYGSNGPLWSLSYEFWYYMVFPLLFLFLLNSRKAIKIMYLSLSISIFFLVGLKISLYFIIWLMGALVLVLPIITVLKNRFIFILSLLIMCGALYIRPLVLSGRLFTGGVTKELELFIVDISLGIFSSVCIYLLLHMNLNKTERILSNGLLFNKLSKMLASFSFSLYVIHVPIIEFVYGWALKTGFKGLQPGLASLCIEILLIVAMLLIAFIFSRITEVRTHKIRAVMIRFLSLFTKTRSPNVLPNQNFQK